MAHDSGCYQVEETSSMLGDSAVAAQSIKVSLDSIINGSQEAQLSDGLWVARSEFSKGNLRGE